MALIRLKRGITAGFIPTGLTFGEPAVNTTDGILYCGNTAGETVDMSGVLSFNGKTGHVLFENIDDDLTMNVTGLSAALGITANTTLHVESTATFNGGITSAAGATFHGDVYLSGNHLRTSGGDSVFNISSDRNLEIGDVDDAGNSNTISIRDSHNAIVLTANGQIQLNSDAVKIPLDLQHDFDTNTMLRFPAADTLSLLAGGVTFAEGTTNNLSIPTGASLGSDIQIDGNVLLAEDATVSVAGDTEAVTFNFGGGVLDISSTAVDIKQKLRHRGDADTFINFTPDNISMEAGGVEFLNSAGTGGVEFPVGLSAAGVSEFQGLSAASGVSFAGDLQVEGNILLADDGFIGLNSGQDRIIIDSNGNDITLNTNDVLINSKLTHLGDTDTHFSFSTQDTIEMTTGGVVGITLSAGGISAAGDLQVGGNIIVAEDAEIQIGGDSEHIVFNGSSAQIEMQANEVFFLHRLQHYGDSDTGIQFETNTVNIHAGDIGVDKISVHSAGVEMASGCTFSDSTVLRPKFKDYSETVNAIGSVNSNTAVDFENGNVQTVTVAGNCEFSFSNPPANGNAGTVTLIVTNGGAHTTTFASAVKWPSDVAPSLTTSGVDVISFLTTDGGTNIYGFVGGLNFS